MKAIILGMALIASSALVSGQAQAACTHNAFRLGYDAAELACMEIVNGYAPAFHAPERERTCSYDQVIVCKNAMAQYRREHHGCDHLIDHNTTVYDADGHPIGNARDIWFRWMSTTCNM